ncbi:autophagy protein atg9 [Orobanche gracilis]
MSQYTGMMLLEEMASIFLTPYLLLFVVPKRVDDILQFITDFTVDVEGVGHICSFSLFDFRSHGNRKYGSIFHSPRERRSSQGKMEKSFLSFQIAYPSWEPNADGKQFISSLKIFRDLKLHQDHQTVHSVMRDHNPNLRNLGLAERNSFLLSREIPHATTMRDFHQLESMWLIDGEHKNFPYILDWYYTSSNHDRDDEQHSGYARSGNYENDMENPSKDPWTPPNPTRNNVFHDGKWGGDLFDDHRLKSHLEASTSAPLFQESFLRDREPNETREQPGRSHWWARTQPQGPDPGTSFIEPPNFFRGAYHDFCENSSERSVEEQHLEFMESGGLLWDDLKGGISIFHLMVFIEVHRGVLLMVPLPTLRYMGRGFNWSDSLLYIHSVYIIRFWKFLSPPGWF